MKPYPNEELERMSKREIIRLYKRTVEQLNDAVPVVRCKDCKWNKADKWVDCALEMNGMYGRTTDNYCSLPYKERGCR